MTVARAIEDCVGVVIAVRKLVWRRGVVGIPLLDTGLALDASSEIALRTRFAGASFSSLSETNFGGTCCLTISSLSTNFACDCDLFNADFNGVLNFVGGACSFVVSSVSSSLACDCDRFRAGLSGVLTLGGCTRKEEG